MGIFSSKDNSNQDKENTHQLSCYQRCCKTGGFEVRVNSVLESLSLTFEQKRIIRKRLVKQVVNLEEDRLEIIKIFKSTRNEEDVSNALLLLEEKAKTNENLIPYIIDCSDHKCTLGEISSSLKKAFGEYSL